MEEEYFCREKCPYRRDQECALDLLNLAYPVFGTACCEYIFEDELKTYS